MEMEWFYGKLNAAGELVDAKGGRRMLSERVYFANIAEAEQYCEDQDYRITVQG